MVQSRLVVTGYTVREERHALAILSGDFPEALEDLRYVLDAFTLSPAAIVSPGGGKSQITQRLEGLFNDRGWKKERIHLEISLDGTGLHSSTHEMDHFKHFGSDRPGVALEIEWNNKDPFYDRDLENFRRLHQLGALSLGIVITRGPRLEESMRRIFDEHYGDAETAKKKFTSKFGTATTNWKKLEDRLARGVGNPAPLLLIGIGPERLR